MKYSSEGIFHTTVCGGCCQSVALPLPISNGPGTSIPHVVSSTFCTRPASPFSTKELVVFVHLFPNQAVSLSTGRFVPHWSSDKRIKVSSFTNSQHSSAVGNCHSILGWPRPTSAVKIASVHISVRSRQHLKIGKVRGNRMGRYKVTERNVLLAASGKLHSCGSGKSTRTPDFSLGQIWNCANAEEANKTKHITINRGKSMLFTPKPRLAGLWCGFPRKPLSLVHLGFWIGVKFELDPRLFVHAFPLGLAPNRPPRCPRQLFCPQLRRWLLGPFHTGRFLDSKFWSRS